MTDKTTHLFNVWKNAETKARDAAKKLRAALDADYPAGSVWKMNRGTVTATIIGPWGEYGFRVTKSGRQMETFVHVTDLRDRVNVPEEVE